MNNHPTVARTDETRLAVALSAQRPLETDPTPLEVERLLDSHQRRVTVDDHQRFRDSITRPVDRFDEIDMAAADPIRDHTPRHAPGHKVNRVLRLLDQLDAEKSNRRFNA